MRLVSLANSAGKIGKAGLVDPEQLLGRRRMAACAGAVGHTLQILHEIAQRDVQYVKLKTLAARIWSEMPWYEPPLS